MKKLWLCVGACALLVGLALWASRPVGAEAKAIDETDPEWKTLVDGTEMILQHKQEKILVVYFSASGHTKRVAEIAAEAIGADLFEIVPEKPYTEADLDYKNPKSRSSMEHADANILPTIASQVKDWDKYTAVLIGYPIWWGEAPNIVKGFVKNHDFSGKAVVPFATSHSTGFGKSGEQLKTMCTWYQWLRGECFTQDIDAESVSLWAKGLLTGDGPRG